MSYYIIKARSKLATFETIFTDDQFNPIAFKYKYGKIFLTSYSFIMYRVRIAVIRSREGGNLYRKPRKLTENEYIQLLDALL